MSTSSDEQRYLLILAREKWITIQGTILAYNRSLSRAKWSNEILKISTIVSALLTTLTGFFSSLALTLSSGMLTTVLATAQKIYSPYERYKKFWDCMMKLEKVKSDILFVSYDLGKREADDSRLQLELIVTEIMRIVGDNPYYLTEKDKIQASKAFEDTIISKKLTKAQDV